MSGCYSKTEAPRRVMAGEVSDMNVGIVFLQLFVFILLLFHSHYVIIIVFLVHHLHYFITRMFSGKTRLALSNCGSTSVLIYVTPG